MRRGLIQLDLECGQGNIVRLRPDVRILLVRRSPEDADEPGASRTLGDCEGITNLACVVQEDCIESVVIEIQHHRPR